jgi:NAD(P)-dependent dehydrogenase (short-subunit alcohol dehydrogenase family)
MSHAILEAGATLIVTGRREAELIAHRGTLPVELRDRYHVIVGDVTAPETARQIRLEVEQRFGALHGVVNNAYFGKVGELNSIEAGDFLVACTYNLIAPFSLVKELTPLLELSAKNSRASASIVNIASMFGMVSPDPSIYGDSGLNNPIHYGATKAGMIQMTRYLACHLGHRGIRVNSIAPGPFPNSEIEPGIPRFYEKLAEKVPIGRIGRPEEVAGPVVFLLSDAAAYVNGANLAVDGGWTAW